MKSGFHGRKETFWAYEAVQSHRSLTRLALVTCPRSCLIFGSAITNLPEQTAEKKNTFVRYTSLYASISFVSSLRRLLSKACFARFLEEIQRLVSYIRFVSPYARIKEKALPIQGQRTSSFSMCSTHPFNVSSAHSEGAPQKPFEYTDCLSRHLIAQVVKNSWFGGHQTTLTPHLAVYVQRLPWCHHLKSSSIYSRGMQFKWNSYRLKEVEFKI